jgi:hypothetical protein
MDTAVVSNPKQPSRALPQINEKEASSKKAYLSFLA